MFLNKCLYYKRCIIIKFTFLLELMSINQANQKSAIFVTIGIFYIKALRFRQMSAMDVMFY